MMKIGKNTIKIVSLLLAAVTLLCAVPAFTPTAGALYDTEYVNTGNIRDDIVGVALSQAGYIEGTDNNNKFGSAFGLNNRAWCALFVWWCCQKAEVPGLPMTASCNGLIEGFKANGAKWYSVNSGYAPRKGDLVFYNVSWDSDDIGHSGIVVEDSPAAGPIKTIEGNTTNPNAATLDGAFEKTRPLNGDILTVVGYLSLTDVPATSSVHVEPVEEAEEVEIEEAAGLIEEEAVEEIEVEEVEVEETEDETETVKHGWELDESGWHYYDEDGVLLTHDWAPTSYGWRWLDDDGNLDETVWSDAEMNIIYV